MGSSPPSSRLDQPGLEVGGLVETHAFQRSGSGSGHTRDDRIGERLAAGFVPGEEFADPTGSDQCSSR